MGIVTGYLSQLVSSGIKLLNNGTAVSSSNPLPVINEQKFSGVLQVSDGRMWECPLITKAGVSAKYSAICIFNPTISDIRMIYNSSAPH
jgi:hypothetical protein